MTEKLKVFEAFAGYGSQSMALKRLGIDFEVVGISEIDNYAIQAYMAVHGDTPNYGDISKINWSSVPNFDFFTYSFPCTDISSAGQQKGLEEGSGTRSSLLWECKKAIEAKKPKYLMMENVKALTSKKFMPYLKIWLNYLADLGYSNYTQVLNAKSYGIPQNRERVFVVSILGNVEYQFPRPFELKLKLKDLLEQQVDERYYLSDKAIAGFNRHKARMKERGYGFGWKPTDGNCIASCVLTTAGSRPDDNFIIEIEYKGKKLQEGDGLYTGNSEEFFRGGLNDVSRTLKANVHDAGVVQNYRIRKLTPRECFRLMGVTDEDIDKIEASGVSRTQQYKMAGNSIVVDVLYYIFQNLFIQQEDKPEGQLSFNFNS